MIMTTNALIKKGNPMVGVMTCSMPARLPPTPAKQVPNPKQAKLRRSALMDINIPASRSCVIALIALPGKVRFRKKSNAKIMAIDIPRTTRRLTEILKNKKPIGF